MTSHKQAWTKGIAAIRHYIAMRERMPLRNLGRSVHAIHGGTEFGAEISFDDLKEMVQSHSEMYEALKALELQALQSDVNNPSNEWGREALDLARVALTKAEGGKNV